MSSPDQQPPDILKLFPEGYAPQNPEAVDNFLRDLPHTDAMTVPRELAKKVPDATEQFFEQVGQTTRRIQEDLRRLGFYASVFSEMIEKHPDALTRHSPEMQAKIGELVSRLEPSAQENQT